MTDSNEIEALKASLRGAVQAAAALASLQVRIDALDPHMEIAADDLEELARITLANAVAAQAVRGLVATMRTRRGAGAA